MPGQLDNRGLLMNERELMCFQYSAGFGCEPCITVGFLITNGQFSSYMELFMLAEDNK